MKEFEEKQESSTIHVKRQFVVEGKVLSTEENEETIAVHKFVTEPGAVGLSAGMTVNLGDYESVRVEVTSHMPCYREEEEEAWAFVKDKVEKRLGEQLREVRMFLNSKSTPIPA